MYSYHCSMRSNRSHVQISLEPLVSLSQESILNIAENWNKLERESDVRGYIHWTVYLLMLASRRSSNSQMTMRGKCLVVVQFPPEASSRSSWKPKNTYSVSRKRWMITNSPTITTIYITFVAKYNHTRQHPNLRPASRAESGALRDCETYCSVRASRNRKHRQRSARATAARRRVLICVAISYLQTLSQQCLQYSTLEFASSRRLLALSSRLVSSYSFK